MSARELFYHPDKAFSETENRAYARDELVYNVTEEILIILEDSDISKKELARRLGKSKSFVTQVLSGARNMTLGTLSDICFALGVKPCVTMRQDKNLPSYLDSGWTSESANSKEYREVASQRLLDGVRIDTWSDDSQVA